MIDKNRAPIVIEWTRTNIQAFRAEIDADVLRSAIAFAAGNAFDTNGMTHAQLAHWIDEHPESMHPFLKAAENGRDTRSLAARNTWQITATKAQNDA